MMHRAGGKGERTGGSRAAASLELGAPCDHPVRVDPFKDLAGYDGAWVRLRCHRADTGRWWLSRKEDHRQPPRDVHREEGGTDTLRNSASCYAAVRGTG